MSSSLVPTPEQFRVFCEFGFSQLSVNIKIFYCCCTQCGLEAVRDDMEDDTCFMFATVEDIERAGEDGLLYFHHGFKAEDTKIGTNTEIAEQMVSVLQDQGMQVDWNGDAGQRFKVSVDRQSFADLATHLNEKINTSDPIPTTAIEIESDHPGYKIFVWLDQHGDWCFDVSDESDEHVRGKETSRDEAVRSALDAVEELYLDVN